MSLRNNPKQQEFVEKIIGLLLQNLVKNATPRKHIRFMHNYKKKTGRDKACCFYHFNLASHLIV
jgi:hypothetical protein